MRLVDKNNKEIKIGDPLITFRGHNCVLIDYEIPYDNNGRGGKIYVKFSDGSESRYFPSVCDLKFIE